MYLGRVGEQMKLRLIQFIVVWATIANIFKRYGGSSYLNELWKKNTQWNHFFFSFTILLSNLASHARLFKVSYSSANHRFETRWSIKFYIFFKSFREFENKNLDNLAVFKSLPAFGIKLLYDASYNQVLFFLSLLKAVQFESNRTVIIIWIWCSFVHIHILSTCINYYLKKVSYTTSNDLYLYMM